MAVKQNLWSLTLTPGEKYPIFMPHDVVLTSAALGEELVNANGRSVIKLTHIPVNPRELDSDSEVDSDFDSDDEEVDGEQDEFELDVEEGFKKIEKMDQDGELDDEDDEEEDDEEDDEDEDDDFEATEQTVVLCSLIAGKVEQAPLNITLVEQEALLLEVTGENVVHLVGNYIQQDGHRHDDDDEEDYDSEDFDDYDDLSLDDEDEVDEAPKGKITEIAAPAKAKKAAPAIPVPAADAKLKAAAKPTAAAAPAAVDGKKRKADDITSSPAAKADTSAEGLSKAQKKKLAKKAKTEGGEEKKEAPKEVKKEAGKGTKKTLPSGLVIEDIKVGDGPVARTGKRLGMRYIGKLENGKQFDANTAGKPFAFVLGKGEVIRGWDDGLAGMAVGGERRLTIPAPLAYGSQKIPGIPKNSTLKFDVKLVSVN